MDLVYIVQCSKFAGDLMCHECPLSSVMIALSPSIWPIKKTHLKLSILENSTFGSQ